jgi:hypothetical protein
MPSFHLLVQFALCGVFATFFLVSGGHRHEVLPTPSSFVLCQRMFVFGLSLLMQSNRRRMLSQFLLMFLERISNKGQPFRRILKFMLPSRNVVTPKRIFTEPQSMVCVHPEMI